jgi:hypothetical protein
MFFSPGEWMPISPVNFLWLTDLHDLHGIPTPGYETRPAFTKSYSFAGSFVSEDLLNNRVKTCLTIG